jgi:putative transposase
MQSSVLQVALMNTLVRYVTKVLPGIVKRVLRVYRGLKMTLKRKRKRRLPARIKQPLQQQAKHIVSYSMDFMSDALTNGRKVKILNIMDDCTRESLSAYVDYSILGERVVDVVKNIIAERGKPDFIRVDNGPEFNGKSFTSWCQKVGIEVRYIQPGRPMQNGFIERLNRMFREDVLDVYQFNTLEQLRGSLNTITLIHTNH